ncbi:iron-sulfur cluster-binding protein [Helicobacter monodelphidis]|uniref:LutB/LldF family L-lactate oxidation iron-sulfur protein n=1 Tax=Helicobacter sp. 15-1451 TaxID=2004995 RepID=UPI000DCDC300|nr:LutB/LldF family L-lactate oxidation iron-sulfur protein [Helicobacter sp. 15-1451]RAX59301.1 iron-sulfur cluster-binding protein [Helicobacter sp. 15-1451]
MKFYHSKEEYEQVISRKLEDKQLKENLGSVMGILRNNRKKLIADSYGDWEGLREQARSVKQKSLSNLGELLQTFEANATKNGFIVHWAKDGSEANEIILGLMRQYNANRILKGKSMASEEIHLNQYLKERDIEAIETDLGELIIQLNGEPPVHIVVPAIHKNRFEVGEIFHKHLGVEKKEEIKDLNAIARNHLRSKFQDFKIGLSGVNFAIADEGAIWLIENEGNGRMSTTACDVHVAICGIEKVIESFEDAAILDTMLVPSATGQSTTCYKNIISGPRKNGDLDGPKETHIILLDNGRSHILSDPLLYNSLNCIRCGACMNHCPVYDKIGGHAYLATYPGPIGEVISPQLFGMDNCGYILNLCSLCGRCSEVCPVKIPLAENIRILRSEKVGEGRKTIKGQKNTSLNRSEKWAMKTFAWIASHGFLWRSTLCSASIFSSLLEKFSNKLPGLKVWTSCRSFPTLNGQLHRKVKNLQGVIYE